MSQTQATLINRMAAKPELVAPAETDDVAVFKTVNTPVASINIDGYYQTLNRYECPNESLNVISIQINENERMMAHLKARWAREKLELLK